MVLGHELLPQLLISHRLQVLQLLLLFYGADHCEAVTVFEEVLDESAYPVLGLHLVAGALLRLERILEVLLRGDGVARLVYESQAEVAHHPQECWKVFGHFVWVAVAQDL